MIQVVLPPPPPNYESEVKDPGEAFLKNNPNPTKRDWKIHRYWHKIHNYLYSKHSGICLYCASWTPRKQKLGKTDHTSIDHFKPKKLDAQLAYEWSNFRMCRSRLNNYKGDSQDVIDPCIVSNDWFYLDFTSFLVKASPHVTNSRLKQDIVNTIKRLHLNSDDYVHERSNVIKEYSLDNLSFKILEEKFPFIAYQMRTQSFDKIYKGRLKKFFQKKVRSGQTEPIKS
jgi:hypothetical protein